jgi:hypothetical protein
MKNTVCLVGFLLFLVSSISAQFVSPVPVVETEVRDNTSIRMRSIELDRVKRDLKKTSSEKIGPASVNKFLEIKEDFEKIQKLESGIVTTYTTGKIIQYSKIALLSAEIIQSASRLKGNLFAPQNKDKNALSETAKAEEKAETLPKDVKNLIVELDNAVGAFVNSPIFVSSKKAKLDDKEKAEADLEQIIRISAALKQESEKQTQPKN